MNRTTATISTAILMLSSSSAFAQARVAVAHFAPFADTIDGTAVNISVNGTPVEALQGVKFKQFTDYIEFTEGTYTIDVTPVGATEPAITGEFDLTDGMSYTVQASSSSRSLRRIVRPAAGTPTMPTVIRSSSPLIAAWQLTTARVM